MADELGMEFELRLNCDPAFSPVRDEALVRKEVGAASREEYRRMNGVDYAYSACFQLWDAPQINWDGTMVGCCLNIFTDYGNVFSDGLLTVLNSDKIQYAREMVSGEKPPGPDIYCASCPLYLDLSSSGKWMKRGPYHRALRSAYGYLRLPYTLKLSAYRFLRGPNRLPPII